MVDLVKLAWVVIKFTIVLWALGLIASAVNAGVSDPSKPAAIFVDLIEINHVYYESNGVIKQRLDQALFRNISKTPNHFNAKGEKFAGGTSHEIDGWVLLYNCRDYSNDDEYRKFCSSRDEYIKNRPVEAPLVKMSDFSWEGEFVSPAVKLGSFYRLRLTGSNGDVIVLARRLLETFTTFDVERHEKERPHVRKLSLNSMRNVPTVWGEARKKRDQ